MPENEMPSPLEVLLSTMHEHWRNDRTDQATKLAQIAAPYVHARAIAAPRRATSSLTDRELAQFVADDDADDSPGRI